MTEPGAYIIKDGQTMPDLNDEAMAARAALTEKAEEETTDADD